MLAELRQQTGVKHIEANEPRSDPFGNWAPYTAYPQNEGEVSRILSYASQKGLKIIPVGGGTKRGFGGTEPKADVLLSLSHLKGIVEHSPGDMIATIKPGTTIAELKAKLAEHGQMLPLDPYWPDEATIGGVIAANDSGPKRLKYGSARDHVIGLRIVYPDGRIIRSGGKVVKNVAGYDMNKLFIGSMGTLGVLTEITVKLRPLPQDERLVLLSFAEDKLANVRQFALRLLDSVLEPVTLELLNPAINKRLTDHEGYGLAITFEDREKAVNYQEQWIKTNIPQGTCVEVLSRDKTREWWNRFAMLPPNPNHQCGQHEIALKIGSQNMDVLPIIEECQRLALQHGIVLEAHGGLGHGLSAVYIRHDARQVETLVRGLRSFVEQRNGYVVIRHAPLSFRQKVSVWGEKPAYFPLLEGIRKTIDSQLILNHKRFVGGL
ncbi:FAD linked oxidase domain protein [Caldalkalibacillus thermarum TA2.A1]|uniref:FAD linked oxidase domain protein n=1 Tax=Caldalkalibacillus thermarum (strain TA2.A1) TaxID=986075 RepID=F5L8T9_CALTT|nr:FAD-binding oxidoreductase [Caldalkalibacillus thermarum]EGL82221.1 FAD linked oxidase domain protein [Caldalkalibacillus thermarum TA2.A1]QZT32763.1 FAD-binding oxidoreductase [Caldalkalibacillus thermarum TA2.A1]GGK13867.1 glycolate oxidase [Caldalkalibacillus thermarum]